MKYFNEWRRVTAETHEPNFVGGPNLCFPPAFMCYLSPNEAWMLALLLSAHIEANQSTWFPVAVEQLKFGKCFSLGQINATLGHLAYKQLIEIKKEFDRGRKKLKNTDIIKVKFNAKTISALIGLLPIPPKEETLDEL